MESMNQEEFERVKSVLSGSQKVLVLTGAGISAESGVPTFRGGGGASVWRGMPFEQLSSVEMVQKDLPLVWEWFDYRLGVIRFWPYRQRVMPRLETDGHTIS